MDYRHLFGPLLSRRLGLSLGVDLINHKVCSFDCVYCECGATTEKTTERREYVPIFRVIEELKVYFADRPQLDYITFSGSGEPLLNKGIGVLIQYIKEHFIGYPLALLTNSVLLSDPEVRSEILPCDLVVPSLDAVSKEAFNKVNRAAPGIHPMEMIEGLVQFRREFKGKIWLEIFIVPGANDSPQELDLLSKAAERIKPDRVQINMLDRPGTESWVRPLTAEEMSRVMGFFKRIKVELVPQKASTRLNAMLNEDMPEKLFSIIQRRPIRLEDIARTLGVPETMLSPILDKLIAESRIEFVTEERGVYFRAK
ncbi:MAG: radical SAM protein [Elusimicrobia bacterium RIFOXYB2_FULL_49_7]|nr:MAG: radical SAM protein [Elusimicrobia bacterium RIFOXYB2_FULL_49_7]